MQNINDVYIKTSVFLFYKLHFYICVFYISGKNSVCSQIDSFSHL